MFDCNNKYSKDMELLVNEIEEKQLGVQVITAKKWGLPLLNFEVEIDITKSKKFNIIEEFILKIASTDLGCTVTEDSIRNMLGLDDIFTKEYIGNLTAAGAFVEEMLPELKLTKLGEEQYKLGHALTRLKKEYLQLSVQPNFNFIYNANNIDKKDNSIPLKLEFNDSNVDFKRIFNSDEGMCAIDEIAKENKINLSRETVSHYISKISDIKKIETNNVANFVEVWIYDIIDDKLFCRVWDYQNGSYNEILSKYILENYPLKESDFVKSDREICKTVPNKFEELFKEEVKKNREIDNLSKSSLRLIRGSQIKKEFNNCLKRVKKYLYIQSPWISDSVMDNEFIGKLKQLVNNNCKIYITWGMSRDVNLETRKPTDELLDKLNKIMAPNKMPAVFVYWVGNNHSKEIIVDDELHLAGSFNWLSYRGDYLPRGESVYITNDHQSIIDAKNYWENILFNKIIEDLWGAEYVKELNALLNLESKKDKVNEYMLIEVSNIFKSKKEDAYKKLYNLSLIYFKNQILDEVFTTSIDYLLGHNKYIKEIFIMLNYYKMNNNSNIYDEYINRYKVIFIDEKILDKKLKASKAFSRKNIANELVLYN